MYSIKVNGHRILSARKLAPYLPELAVQIAKILAFAPGEIAFSDVFRSLETDPAVFPQDIGDLGKQMRMQRLLEQPIQIDDMVMSLRKATPNGKRRLYEKTKFIVLAQGTPAHSETAAAVASHGCVARPMSAMEPMRMPAAAQLQAGPRVELAPAAMRVLIDDRLLKLETGLAKLWDVLVVEGVDPAAGAESKVSSLDVAALVARMDKLERYVKDQVIAIGRQVNSLIPVGDGTPIDLS